MLKSEWPRREANNTPCCRTRRTPVCCLGSGQFYDKIRQRKCAARLITSLTPRITQRTSCKLELLEQLLRFLRVVRNEGDLDEVVSDAGEVDRLEVDACVTEPVGDVGELAGLVLEEHDVHLALG